MVTAPHVITLPISVHHRVVNLMKPGQIIQNMKGEPGESLGPADQTQRHFQVGTLPAALEHTPGRREALSQKRRALALTAYLGPEIVAAAA